MEIVIREQEERDIKIAVAHEKKREWDRNQEGHAIVDKIVRKLISDSVLLSSRIFSMKPLQNEILRVERVRKGEEMRKELVIRIKLEKERKLEEQRNEKVEGENIEWDVQKIKV